MIIRKQIFDFWVNGGEQGQGKKDLGWRPPIEHTCYCVYFSERSGSVVECLTRDRGAARSSLTGITVLCP